MWMDRFNIRDYLLRRVGCGFTIVEILIALAIFTMIVTSTFTIFRSASKSWQRGEERSEKYNTARVAIGKMKQEISQAIINNNLCRFIGTPSEISFISFITTADNIFEMAEIRYRLDQTSHSLIRNEQLNPDYDFMTQDRSDILADNIDVLKFLYFDGTSWRDTWDSSLIENEDTNLPRAVKIHIEVTGKRDKKGEVFESIAYLKTE